MSGIGMRPGSGTPSINLHDLVRTLFPITRSITGMGVRETLAILGRHILFPSKRLQWHANSGLGSAAGMEYSWRHD